MFPSSDQWSPHFCGTYPYEKVDHEENVESEIDLLGYIFAPRNAFFHAFAVFEEDRKISCVTVEAFNGNSPRGVYEVNDEGSDWKDEHQAHLVREKTAFLAYSFLRTESPGG